MGPLLHLALLLTISLLYIPQTLASDWNSILPPGSELSGQPEVVFTKEKLAVGETLLLPIPASRSYNCTVEVDGDSVTVVAQNSHESATLQGVTPGKSTVRILRKFWQDPDVPESYQLVQVVDVTVTSSFREDLLPVKQHDRQKVPIPAQKDGMEWEGYLSHQSDELVTVITDGKEWNSLWQRAFGAPAPEIDFEKYAVACVFLGFQSDWLYSIHLEEPCIEGNLMIIPYDLMEIILELEEPFRASGQYRMKAYEKKKGYGMIVQNGSCEEKELPNNLLPEL
ncbi:MAG: hypothetical protein EG828_00650 [Deltaproteobacteria bacterium]|nr:hypothetical protein [Deltaproteobacteria bacterium]